MSGLRNPRRHDRPARVRRHFQRQRRRRLGRLGQRAAASGRLQTNQRRSRKEPLAMRRRVARPPATDLKRACSLLGRACRPASIFAARPGHLFERNGRRRQKLSAVPPREPRDREKNRRGANTVEKSAGGDRKPIEMSASTPARSKPSRRVPS
jgi:hypothetical protein